MNVAATFLAAAAVLGVLAAIAGALPDYVLKPNLRASAAGFGTALTGAAGVVAGIAAMTGDAYTASVPGLLPLSGVTLSIDALSGPFLTAIGVAAVAGGVYAVGDARSRVTESVTPLFVVAMLLAIFSINDIPL